MPKYSVASELLPVALVYDILDCGPRHRFIADDVLVANCNLQNLPRGGRLRRSLRAPKGKMVVACDSGQIEARINAWLAGQHDLLEIFRAKDAGLGPDPYRILATKLFNVTIDQVTDDQRYAAKVVFLASGYGMGPDKLLDTLANAKPNPVHITRDTAVEWIETYRSTNNMIKRSWKRYNDLLPRLTLPTCNVALGPLTLVHEAVRLPNGLFIRYPGIKTAPNDWGTAGEISFMGRAGVRTKLYGGLFCENICQALARIAIGEQMLTMSRQGMRILTCVHDEILVLTTAKQAEKTYNRMVKIMSTPPEWAPDLPLAAEGKFAEYYAK